VVGNGSSFLTAHLEISGYSSVKLAQKLEREIVGNCYFKTESLTIFINCSNSLIEKSSIWNEPMKGFLSQPLSLLFGVKYSSHKFCNYLRCSVMSCLTLSDTTFPDSSRYSFIVSKQSNSFYCTC
jgi:hypothetical protein